MKKELKSMEGNIEYSEETLKDLVQKRKFVEEEIKSINQDCFEKNRIISDFLQAMNELYANHEDACKEFIKNQIFYYAYFNLCLLIILILYLYFF